jgi:hypothetical protein
MGLVVTVPDELTTQWPAVTTMRLVQRAPLHELLPFRIRTTALLPRAELPPTTAFVGADVTRLAHTATTETIAVRITARHLLGTTPRL